MPFYRTKLFISIMTAALAVQLAGCGTILYPERRGQTAGRLDVGVVILDGLGLLFFLIPGIIAFAVDFSNGCIYLPVRHPVVTTADLRQIRFDPKHTTVAQIEKMIKDRTGYTVLLNQEYVHTARLHSSRDMIMHFANAEVHYRLAFNRQGRGTYEQ